MRPRHCAASAAKRASSSAAIVGIAGVAQHIDMEAVADAARRRALHHRLEIADHPVRRLVADAHQDRGRGGDRLVAADARRGRHHGRDRIARKAHDQKADGRRSRSRSPIQGSVTAKSSQQHDVDDAEAAGRQRQRRERQQRRPWSTATSTANSTRRPAMLVAGARRLSGLAMGERSSTRLRLPCPVGPCRI